MIYHFMGASPYTYKFVYFMINNRKEFNLAKHYFILIDSSYFKWDNKLSNKVNYNIIKTKWGFLPSLNKVSDSDKLLIHGLFYPQLLIYLYFKRKIIRRSIWSIWGGDLNFYRDKENSFKHNLLEYLRKVIIPRIPVILTTVKGDYDLACDVYGSNAKHMYSVYPNPVDYSLIDNESLKCKKNGEKVIMIGNSGEETNNHEKVFEMLCKYKLENFKIICPLSYGNPEYVKKIINKGKDLFGKKFTPLIKFISSSDYAKIVSDVDVAIMNHDRQQGLGTILLLLAAGKKVYVRGDTTHYMFLKEKKIKLFKIQDIIKYSYEELFYSEQDVLKSNAKIVIEEFSNINYVNLWNNVFEVNLNE